MNLDDIQKSIVNDCYEIKTHAFERMDERNITMVDLEKIVKNGEVIEEYPDDRPYPSCLIFGISSQRPLHAVVGYNKSSEKSYIITVYEPDPEEFGNDFKSRKHHE